MKQGWAWKDTELSSGNIEVVLKVLGYVALRFCRDLGLVDIERMVGTGEQDRLEWEEPWAEDGARR